MALQALKGERPELKHMKEWIAEKRNASPPKTKEIEVKM
jgi:hypothetical protein